MVFEISMFWIGVISGVVGLFILFFVLQKLGWLEGSDKDDA